MWGDAAFPGPFKDARKAPGQSGEKKKKVDPETLKPNATPVPRQGEGDFEKGRKSGGDIIEFKRNAFKSSSREFVRLAAYHSSRWEAGEGTTG